MHQGCLLKILWITSSVKTKNISSTKKESLRLKTTSRRKGPKLKNTNLSRIRENVSKDQVRANDTLQQLGCQNWLNIPIDEFNYNLNQQQFLDAVRLRYQPIPNLPTRCPRGEKVDAHMAMSR